ncbi:uncharacterized protein LOC129226469 [Uloborus diversus]|uniref:uncharacterized protein LOC129226469 n=1 Tax=Uloborus diversus TaxID=327109 RepID=UPI00240A492F|nr:uncharacterized protein LOC129226469 [Uloborus diversus]
MSSLSGIKCWGEPLPPQEFLRKYGLPQVVRVLEGNKVQGPARVDLDRPLMLYKAYICQQVHARSIDRDKNGGITYVGPPLILPDTYQGWLAVITEDGHTAGYFSSVSEVASAQVPYFLSRENTQGYKEATDSKGNIRYSKVKIKAGEVLQFLGAYEDTTYTSSKQPVRPLRYAKVVDRQGDLLFLPFPTAGKFFSVAGRRTRSVSHVYRLSQLLSVAPLPLTVRVVSGARPRACPFTGLLRLEWAEERHVILACALRGAALGPSEPALLEVDVGSEFRFLRPLDEQKARLSKAFNKMLRHCADNGEHWRQQIKVAHHVVPTMQASSSRNGGTSSGDTYEDEDSAVRSSTVKSLSSTKSSASSRLFQRLKLLHQSWKNGHRKADHTNATSGSDDSGLPKDKLPPSTSDFHLYERVRNQRRYSWGRSSISTEILDDDGYVTSDFGEDSSTYDSVC